MLKFAVHGGLSTVIFSTAIISDVFKMRKEMSLTRQFLPLNPTITCLIEVLFSF